MEEVTKQAQPNGCPEGIYGQYGEIPAFYHSDEVVVETNCEENKRAADTRQNHRADGKSACEQHDDRCRVFDAARSDAE